MWDVIEEKSVSVLLYICTLYLSVLCVILYLSECCCISLSFTRYISTIFSSDARCDPVTPGFVHCAVFGVA